MSMQGELTSGNSIANVFDTVYSPKRGTSPWEYFPTGIMNDPGAGFILYDEFEDNNTTKTTDVWQIVKGTGGAVALTTGSMGWISIPTAASSNDYQCFFTNEPIFVYANNIPCAWEASINVTEANTNKSSWFAGFTSVTTTGFLTNSGVPAASYSGGVIYKTESTLNLTAQVSNGSTQSGSGTIATVVSGQTYIISMVFLPAAASTGNVMYFVSTVATGTTGVATSARTLLASGTLTLSVSSLAAMYFGFGIRAGSGSAETLTADFVQAGQVRYYQ
jgi:hypothetical protein